MGGLEELADLHAVLQAGGRGQRMGDATQFVPKPLRPIAGVPMIERIIMDFVRAGVRRYTVITGWLGERIEDHVRSLLSHRPDVELAFVRETEPRGNAGSLTEFAADGLPLLFTFTDLVTTLDPAELLHRHRAARAHITLASHYESLRLRLGELLVEGDKVIGYQEKPEKRFLICSGVAIIEPQLLKLLDRDRPLGLVDVVNAAIGNGLNVQHWVHGAFWRDVNSEEERVAVEAEVTKLPEGGAVGN